MKFFNELPQQQWLTKPDGNILETLTDSRVLATAGGASLEAVLEKYLWTQYRSTFGIASSVNGVVKFYAPDADGKAGAEAPQLGTNRQLVRLGLVALAATGIEYIPNGRVQYLLLGMAAVSVAHIGQDLIPQFTK